MAAKKAKRVKKSAATIRAKKSVRATEAVPVQTASVAVRAISAPVPPARVRSASVPGRSTSPRAILLGLGGVAAVSLLIVALQPSERAEFASLSAPPSAIALPAALMPPTAIVPPEPKAAPQLETKKPAAPTPVPAAVARSLAADASNDKTAAIEPLKALAIEPIAAAEITRAVPESMSKMSDQAANSVTITGCLASDDDTFVLKDTTGSDAPKARSWRSGFLKKRAATIELLDATKALRLPSFVGQRVEATGMLVNHEMRAQSLRRVAASCS